MTELLALLVTPLSGPVARFGRAGPFSIDGVPIVEGARQRELVASFPPEEP